MATPTRKIGGDVSVFTLGGNAFVGDLSDATIEVTVKDAEGKGVADTDDYPIPVGRSLVITGNLMLSGTAVLAGTANSSTPYVAFTATTGAGSYAGTALIQTHSHKVEREGLQTVAVTMKARSGWTFS